VKQQNAEQSIKEAATHTNQSRCEKRSGGKKKASGAKVGLKKK